MSPTAMITTRIIASPGIIRDAGDDRDDPFPGENTAAAVSDGEGEAV
jgi:hypothetical protein